VNEGPVDWVFHRIPEGIQGAASAQQKDIEKLELWMRQDRRSRRMRELPMKKAKVKWPVKELMVRRQRRLLKRWLRYAENLKATKEKVLYVCEPETGKFLEEENELGSAEDLKNCQEGREEIPDCQWETG
jgi:hypothetical protein